MPRLAVVRRAVVVVVAALVVVAVVVAVAVTAGVRRSLPDRGGQVAVPGLGAQVTVRRDDQGVPQVYADSALDLFAAQGYVTAQDRFFEMDYRRHVTAGRLAEPGGRRPVGDRGRQGDPDARLAAGRRAGACPCCRRRPAPTCRPTPTASTPS
ncbi:hypothetical protein GCM10025868_15600 [Angustibacter aerolatus]|uniref:Penicillin acylase family protein n=1 Tax=Angustibacter aerolatus TaxID=1162965 RepID=A0ABQ6JDP2_9ACTN|nr:penicillin acylase family protein [Angustibacter aerolatus]GMA86310.1 hypothetical protein GCM10025868_15600 [Angustibacter aerolatus]